MFSLPLCSLEWISLRGVSVVPQHDAKLIRKELFSQCSNQIGSLPLWVLHNLTFSAVFHLVNFISLEITE